MKILLVGNNLQTGGASVGANNLAYSLRSVGHEVVCIDKYYDQTFKGSIIRSIRFLERLTEKGFCFGEDVHFVKYYNATVNIQELVSEYKPDIVQLGFIAGNIIDLRALAKVTVPVVMRLSDFWPFSGPFHYPVEGEARSLEKLKRRIASKVLSFTYNPKNFSSVHFVAPSEWSKKVLQCLFDYTVSCTYIPNAVAVRSDMSHLAAVLPLNVSNRVRLTIVAGDLREPRKGVEQALKFLKRVAVLGSLDFDVTLVGKNGGGFSQHGLNEGFSVSWKGSLPKKEVENVIVGSHFLVCPSLVDNSPNVVCESMALGVPVICQKGTGTDSYVDHEFSGLVFDFQDLSDENLLDFSAAVKGMSWLDLQQNALHQVASLNFEAIGRKYTNLYEQLLK